MEAELLGRASKDPDKSTTAATITRVVDRAARIVRSLLRLARRADTTPTRVQMNDLVHDVAEIRQRVLRTESVEFRTTLDQSAPAVLGLGQELQQVVINLVTNAEYVVRGRKPAIVQLRTQAREGWVRLTVDDSGPGVPREIRGRIFDPFFTTKGPDEGTGLGLAICQRVVTEVGGKSWIEDSDPGGAGILGEVQREWEGNGPHAVEGHGVKYLYGSHAYISRAQAPEPVQTGVRRVSGPGDRAGRAAHPRAVSRVLPPRRRGIPLARPLGLDRRGDPRAPNAARDHTARGAAPRHPRGMVRATPRARGPLRRDRLLRAPPGRDRARPGQALAVLRRAGRLGPRARTRVVAHLHARSSSRSPELQEARVRVVQDGELRG